MVDYGFKIKLNKFFNQIFDNQIMKYLDSSKNIENVPRESIIFLEAANKSINNSIDLINKDEYVDSLCLLRSGFEAILFSLAIYFDEETYNVYKHYNSDFYRKLTKNKNNSSNKKIQEIDKKNKDLLSPGIIRSKVAEHYKEVYSELFYSCENVGEVKEELREFYAYLCNFTHPSIVKAYTFKLQNDNENLVNIRTVFKLNINYCKLLLLLALNYFTTRDDMSDIYDLYAILFLTDVNLITDVDKFNELLKKYDEYLYLNITRDYFKRNDKKIKTIQKEIKEISEIKNLNEIFPKIMNDVVEKFDATELLKEYFQIKS